MKEEMKGKKNPLISRQIKGHTFDRQSRVSGPLYDKNELYVNKNLSVKEKDFYNKIRLLIGENGFISTTNKELCERCEVSYRTGGRYIKTFLKYKLLIICSSNPGEGHKMDYFLAGFKGFDKHLMIMEGFA